MDSFPLDFKYPDKYREKEIEDIAESILQHHSAEVIGIKRVGVGKLIRYFLYNPDVKKRYFGIKNKKLFIPVNIGILSERKLTAFWLLILKRVLDSLEENNFNPKLINKVERSFNYALSSKENFIIIDSLRSSIISIVDAGYDPTIFVLNADRFLDLYTCDFCSSFQALYDSSNYRLTYIFTLNRPLSNLNRKVFNINAISFSYKIYVKPLESQDLEYVADKLIKTLGIKIDKKYKDQIIKWSGGHLGLLHLSLLIIKNEIDKNGKIKSIDAVSEDVRMILECEDIYNFLNQNEQLILHKIINNKKLTLDDYNSSKYLWNSGIINNDGQKNRVFSHYFEQYIVRNTEKFSIQGKEYLTIKEKALYDLLTKNENKICDRDTIITHVWPECEKIGISDYAIDRLIGRLRDKIEVISPKKTIKNVRSQGFILQKKLSY